MAHPDGPPSGTRAIPDDRQRSPITGWTREHWEAHADLLLHGVRRYASASYARIALPGRPSVSGPESDALEGFARTFLLAAFRIAGTRGTGPGVGELIDRYSSGLAAGTDPAHPDAWPRIGGNRPSQPMVEAASIALGLHETRSWIWDRLDGAVQQRVAAWLVGFVGRATWPNNWMLFQTVVEEFLCSVDAPHSEDEILLGLRALDGWHLGGGWYTDGDGRRIDHYNGWALHFYPLMWTRLAAGGPRAAFAEELGERLRERLNDFLSDYIHLIGADGAPLHQGRSLIYRFATATPLWTGALFDCSPLEPGTTRRAASGILRHFAQNGAPDAAGLLSLGWHHPHSPTVQEYSGPASPYWAAKGFLGLLLPADHPVWQDEELPLPIEESDTIHVVAGANWLVQGTTADGIVRMHNHGSDGLAPGEPATADPHYSRLAYSTRTAPRTAGPASFTVPDNQLSLIAPDGEVSLRGRIHPLGVSLWGDIGHAASWHTPAFVGPHGTVAAVTGCRVETHTVVADRFEFRLHAVTAPASWGVQESGYSLADDDLPARRFDLRWAVAERADGTTSAIAPLHGFTTTDIESGTRLDAMGAASVVPFLGADHRGGTQIYLSCVVLTGAELDTSRPVPVDVRVTPDEVSLRSAEFGLLQWRRVNSPAGAQQILIPEY